MTTPPIANLADLELTSRSHGQSFEASFALIGPLIGAQKLGCTLVVVPPGKNA